jgi:Rod binding domain-containing protein
MTTNAIPSGAAVSGAAISRAAVLVPPGAVNAGDKPGAAGGKTTTAKEAATQFEGLLIEEMLRSAHETNPGNLSGDDPDDSQSDTMFDMAAQQFAQIMAKQGGFGIAKVVDAGIARQQASIDSKTGDAITGDAKTGGAKTGGANRAP